MPFNVGLRMGADGAITWGAGSVGRGGRALADADEVDIDRRGVMRLGVADGRLARGAEPSGLGIWAAVVVSVLVRLTMRSAGTGRGGTNADCAGVFVANCAIESI